MNNRIAPVPAPSIAKTNSSFSESKDILTAAKGGGISFIGRIFEYVVRFAFGILVARVVGVEQYGLYTIAITVSLIASNLAMLGLQTALVRFLPPAIREKDAAAIWSIVEIGVGLPAIISILLGAILYLFADPIATAFFSDQRMGSLLRICGWLIPLEALGSMAYVITISFKQPKYSVIANNIISPLLKLLFATGFLAIGLSTQGVLIAQVIASTAGLFVFIYFVNSLFSLNRSLINPVGYMGKMLHYALPVHLGWMVNTLRSSLSTLVLGFLGLATGAGLYAAASRFSMLGSMFYLSIGNISTPIIADLHSQAKTIELRSYYQTTTRWLVMFNIPIFLTSVLFAKPLLSIFGDDFTSGAISMMILACGTLIYTCTGVGAIILDMTDHPKVNTVNSLILVVIAIVLNVLLVPAWGVAGAAAASALSTVVSNVVCLVEVWVLLGLQPYNKSFIKPLLAGAISAVTAFVVNGSLDVSPLFQFTLGFITLWGAYSLSLYIMKISPEDKIVISRFSSRFRTFLPIMHNFIR